jgi:acyl carrier protein
LSSTLKELQDLIQAKYGLDSLALVEFIFDVEDRMGIAVPDDNPNMDTLAELADAIDRVRTNNVPPLQETA